MGACTGWTPPTRTPREVLPARCCARRSWLGSGSGLYTGPRSDEVEFRDDSTSPSTTSPGPLRGTLEDDTDCDCSLGKDADPPPGEEGSGRGDPPVGAVPSEPPAEPGGSSPADERPCTSTGPCPSTCTRSAGRGAGPEGRASGDGADPPSVRLDGANRDPGGVVPGELAIRFAACWPAMAAAVVAPPEATPIAAFVIIAVRARLGSDPGFLDGSAVGSAPGRLESRDAKPSLRFLMLNHMRTNSTRPSRYRQTIMTMRINTLVPSVAANTAWMNCR